MTGIRQGRKNLKPQHGASNLQQGTVPQGSVRISAAAGYRNPVDQYFTPDTRTDQQAGAILP